MTGYPDHNFPAFRAAAAKLQGAGYEVTDPSSFEDNEGNSWADCLKRDIPELLKCDGVAVLYGWHNSKGAQLEIHVADALGMPYWAVQWWLTNAPRYAA